MPAGAANSFAPHRRPLHTCRERVAPVSVAGRPPRLRCFQPNRCGRGSLRTRSDQGLPARLRGREPVFELPSEPLLAVQLLIGCFLHLGQIFGGAVADGLEVRAMCLRSPQKLRFSRFTEPHELRGD
jgi:hypothetical protein